MSNTNTTTIEIPAGWSAFYDSKLKKTIGYSQFPNGGKATTLLSILSSDTEDNLKSELTKLGIECKVSAVNPTPKISSTPAPIIAPTPNI